MDETLTAAIVPEVSGHEAPQIDVISSRYLASITSCMSSGGYSPSPTADTWSTSDYNNLEAALEIHFGFDELTADLIGTFLYRIKRYYPTTQSWQRLEVAWRFFRLAGGCVYGKADPLDRVRWDATAGAVYEDENESENDRVSAPELAYCTITLGMNEASYRHMRHVIRLQNQLCSLRRGDSLQDEQGNALSRASYEESYNFAMHGTSVGSGGFDMVYNQIDTMKNRPDFAHFCITAATVLATLKGYGLSAELALAASYPTVVPYLSGAPLRESMAGWLGDAVLPSDSLENPTLGDDDYWSDIDALKIGKSIESNSFNVPVMMSSYFTTSGQFERRANFLEYYSAETAAKCISTCLSAGVRSPSELMALANGDSRFEAGAKFVRMILHASGCSGMYGEVTYNGW